MTDNHVKVGRKVRKGLKRPREYYQAIGAKGGRATVAKHGPDHMADLGRRGREHQSPRPREQYAAMGRIGGRVRADRYQHMREKLERLGVDPQA